MREFFHQAKPAVWTLPAVPSALGPVWGWPAWTSIAGVSVIVVAAFFATATGHLRGGIEEMRRQL